MIDENKKEREETIISTSNENEIDNKNNISYNKLSVNSK